MPVRRRRRHEHTLRFKPDLWGRETESGTVLFDGVVNLDAEGSGEIEPPIMFEVGTTVAVTLNGTEYSGVVEEYTESILYVRRVDIYPEGGESIEIASRTINGTTTTEINATTGAHEGENTLKIVQID